MSNENSLHCLLSKYREHNFENFSLEEATIAINEGLTAIDDVLSQNDGEEDRMVFVFTTIELILNLCCTSSNLTSISLNVWKRYIPLLKSSKPCHVNIIERIVSILIDCCSNILSSVATTLSAIEQLHTFSQIDLDNIGMILFYNQRICATLAYFATSLADLSVTNCFATLLCSHGMLVRASALFEGCIPFVEKSGESLLKACTLRQSDGGNELFCYYSIKSLMQNLMLPNAFLFADNYKGYMMVGTHHLVILYLRFMVECVNQSVELAAPSATLQLMLCIYLESISSLSCYYCGLLSDETMIQSLSEVKTLSCQLITFLDSGETEENCLSMIVVLLIRFCLLEDASDCSVQIMVKSYFSRMLLGGVISNCESATQLMISEHVWDSFYRLLSGVVSEDRLNSAVALVRIVMLAIDSSSMQYLSRQIVISINSNINVNSLCILLREIPLTCLLTTDMQQLLVTALGSVVESENNPVSNALKRECALSVLCAFARECVVSRNSSSIDSSAEKLLSRFATDVSIGTCVVSWLNVLNEYQNQLTSKMNAMTTNNSTMREILKRKCCRLVSVLPMVELLVSMLAAHKLPKGVISVLVETALCCVNSVNLVLRCGSYSTSNNEDRSESSEVVCGVRVACNALCLIIASFAVSDEIIKKMQTVMLTCQTTLRMLNSAEGLLWEVGCGIQLGIQAVVGVLRSVNLPEGRQLLLTINDILKPVDSEVTREGVISHLLSFERDFGMKSCNNESLISAKRQRIE